MTPATSTPTQWQPIETAPKDGTEIIVLSGAKGVSLGWFFRESSRTQTWLNQRGRRINPAYWTPLPPTPTHKGEEGQETKGGI